VIYLLHPTLGAFAVVAAILLIAVTFLTDATSKPLVRAATAREAQRSALGQAVHRNAEVVCAMGIGQRMTGRWTEINAQHGSDQLRASDTTNGYGASVKVLRMFFQSGLFGFGAYPSIHV